MSTLAILLFFLLGGVDAKQPLKGKAHIPSGEFTPLFGLDTLQKAFEVNSFSIDVYPVTYKEFAQFLKSNPEWTKDKVFPMYVDTQYLGNWKKNLSFSALTDAPITQVSWYAASAFCEARGGRLPSTLEWEYAAAASESEANAFKDKVFNEKLLELYSKPQVDASLQNVKKGKANFYGVVNMHGLIWEWTQDFNSFFIASDNRSDGDKSKNNFCGAGAIGAKEKENYSAFIRYAYRGSLQAKYATKNLGFRCAYSEEEKK